MAVSFALVCDTVDMNQEVETVNQKYYERARTRKKKKSNVDLSAELQHLIEFLGEAQQHAINVIEHVL